MLFDLETDAHEHYARTTVPGNPGAPPGLKRYVERLESTGCNDGAATLRARYADVLNTAG